MALMIHLSCSLGLTIRLFGSSSSVPTQETLWSRIYGAASARVSTLPREPLCSTFRSYTTSLSTISFSILNWPGCKSWAPLSAWSSPSLQLFTSTAIPQSSPQRTNQHQKKNWTNQKTRRWKRFCQWLMLLNKKKIIKIINRYASECVWALISFTFLC